VGSFNEGKIYAVVPKEGNETWNHHGAVSPPDVYVIAEELHLPVGVAFSQRTGRLYVSQVTGILVFDSIDDKYMDNPQPRVVWDKYPDNDWHGWKYIRLSPNEDELWVPIGSPCNTCEPEPEFGKMYVHQINMTSGIFVGEPKVWAKGIRNTVGFDFHPESGALWFTENGRDEWGNDKPGDELNYAPTGGMHFGFPYCYEKDTCDPSFHDCSRSNPCSDYTPAKFVLGPHVAALGMKFYRGNQFPSPYNRYVYIAEHGSWNREDPIGYRITRVDIEDPNSYDVFIDGWLHHPEGQDPRTNDSDDAWGRPVDVINLPDGSIMVSDDKAGALYRVRYVGE